MPARPDSSTSQPWPDMAGFKVPSIQHAVRPDLGRGRSRPCAGRPRPGDRRDPPPGRRHRAAAGSRAHAARRRAAQAAAQLRAPARGFARLRWCFRLSQGRPANCPSASAWRYFRGHHCAPRRKCRSLRRRSSSNSPARPRPRPTVCCSARAPASTTASCMCSTPTCWRSSCSRVEQRAAHGQQRKRVLAESLRRTGRRDPAGRATSTSAKHDSLLRQFRKAGLHETVQSSAITWRRRPYRAGPYFPQPGPCVLLRRRAATPASDHHLLIADFEFAK